MACNACKQLDIGQLQNMSTDQLVDLYSKGYKISNTSNIKSMAIEDVGALQYFFFGLWSYLSYKSYKTDHDIWAILFAALSLGSFGGIVGSLRK